MPEGVEIEIYRVGAEAALDREIVSVETPDEWFLKDGATPESVRDALVGERFVAARRRGKLLILDAAKDGEPGPRLGLRFGMTGRLIVDDEAAIGYLEYSSQRNDPAWDRFVVHFADGGDLRLRDPRRLGGVALDPDEDALGVDAFEIKPKQLRDRVLVGEVALKARLLDQSRVAGIGNLIADETMWRAKIDPGRPAGSLDDREAGRLLRALRRVLADFMRDGGSHTGRLQDQRVRGGRCPICRTELDRREIGGRTTFSCPRHQPISG